MLNYDDFIERVRRLSNDAPDPHHPDKDWTDMRKPGNLPADCFWASWVTGGQEGGNCWDSGRPYGLSAESEPLALHGLMALLEGLDVKLREFLVIQEDIVTGGRDTDRGYYGNHTDYGFKYVTFEAVYDRLVEFGYAEARTPAPSV